jgi:hypothetical protein
LCCATALVASPAEYCLAAGPYPIQSPSQAPAQAPPSGPIKEAHAPQVVTKTIMVPHTTYKTITVPVVVCQPEVRQKTVTVCRSVPETTWQTCTETIMVPERRTKTVNYTACRMTYDTVTKNVTVMVPHSEVRQGTRTVWCPQTQEMRTVCKDLGQWSTKSQVDCCGCQQSCQVWQPNVVTEQVPVTVWKPQFVKEPYTYTDIVCRPETREVTERIPKPVYEAKSREVAYVVPVPKQVERRVPRTTFRQVTEEKVVNNTVMVPHRVERQVQVPVCTMVPKQISYTVPPRSLRLVTGARIPAAVISAIASGEGPGTRVEIVGGLQSGLLALVTQDGLATRPTA